MKKICKILAGVVVTLIAVAATVDLSWELYIDGNGWYSREYEKLCYVLWGIVFAAGFFAIVDKLKHLWAKITLGVAASLLYTVFVFLANNFW